MLAKIMYQITLYKQLKGKKIFFSVCTVVKLKSKKHYVFESPNCGREMQEVPFDWEMCTF